MQDLRDPVAACTVGGLQPSSLPEIHQGLEGQGTAACHVLSMILFFGGERWEKKMTEEIHVPGMGWMFSGELADE